MSNSEVILKNIFVTGLESHKKEALHGGATRLGRLVGP